jgi:2-iminobutanoate/2-iminopropanoate deaminase
MKPILFAFALASALFSPLVPAADHSGTGHEGGSMLIRRNYANLPAPAGPYSLAVRHNETLYLSGVTAFGTRAQGKNMAEQAEAIFEQVKSIAQAEGIGMPNLIKVTVFVTSMDDVSSLREVLSRNYEGAYPASSLVQVAGLFSPDVNIEIEAVFGMNDSAVEALAR